MSGVPESNWLPYLGKVVYYRCTNPALKKVFVQRQALLTGVLTLHDIHRFYNVVIMQASIPFTRNPSPVAIKTFGLRFSLWS